MYKSGILLTIVILVLALSSKGQSVPKLKFIQPHLISGINGQKNAVYQFANVITGVDAYVKIENIFGGATLVNIDDSTLGYYDAWQPTVGGPGALGSYSYIKWCIEFKTTAGATYIFPEFDASSIDVDGDNVRVREFVEVNGQSGYDIPTQVPTLLQINNVISTDNANSDDPNPTNVHVLGPVANRTGIDTFSLDVRINYQFINAAKIKFVTGSQIDNNGTTGAIATDRYHCIYFHRIKNSLFSVLPVKDLGFTAKEKNNKVLLTWQTHSEKVFDHVQVERSFDQSEFKKIADLDLSQTIPGGIKEETYVDASAGLQRNAEIFYRLKFSNKKGETFYSDIKTVNLKSFIKIVLQIFPNPFMEKLKVYLEATEHNNVEVKMTSMNGNVIAYEKAAAVRGTNMIEMKDLDSKPSGMYIVTVSVNGEMISSQKVFKN